MKKKAANKLPERNIRNLDKKEPKMEKRKEKKEPMKKRK